MDGRVSHVAPVTDDTSVVQTSHCTGKTQYWMLMLRDSETINISISNCFASTLASCPDRQ